MNNLIIDDIILKMARSVQFSVIENNIFLIHEKNIDFILETIFEHCANEAHCCFHIDRHSNKQCNVTIFTNDTQNFKMIFKYQETKSNPLISFLFKLKYSLVKLSKVVVVLNLDSEVIQTSLSNFNSTNSIIVKNKPFRQNLFISLPLDLMYFSYLYLVGLFSRKTMFVNNIFNDNLITYNPTISLKTNWIMLANLYPTFLWNIQPDTKNESTDNASTMYMDFNFQIYLQNPSYFYTYINTGIDVQECTNILINCMKNSITIK